MLGTCFYSIHEVVNIFIWIELKLTQIHYQSLFHGYCATILRNKLTIIIVKLKYITKNQ